MTASHFTENTIQEIRDRADIVDLISSYLPLKRSGVNHLGLCPFHAEKTPSFNVNAARQFFHCFGCGVGGDVFSFLMRMEGLSFPEAVRRLADRVGVDIPDEKATPEEERRREERERLLRITEVACEFYHRMLLEEPEGAAGRRYLRQRGFEGDMVRQFRLGFAPDRWRALAEHLAGKGFDPKWARDVLGLIRSREGREDYDLFRGRLLFPIEDSRGRVVAFGGRVLDDTLPKYINSAESPIYHKGQILYGLYQAREAMRRSGEAIVVEGYFDHLALYRAGFTNVVATCGTALTPDHARLLKRYCQRLLLLFDQDKAGRKAAFRAMDVLLPEAISVSMVDLEEGEDPDSFLARHGAEAMRNRMASARPGLQVFIEACMENYGPSIEGKARAAEEILGKLKLLPGAIERDLYLKELARTTGVDEVLLKSRLGRSSGQIVEPRQPVDRPRAVQAKVPKTVKSAGQKAQEYLLHLMKADEAWCRKAAEVTPDLLFANPDCRAVAESLIACRERGLEFDQGLFSEVLSEPQKCLLSGIIIKDDQILADDPAQIFDDCLKAVGKERLKIRYQQLQDLIRQADAENDAEQLAAWQREAVEVLMKIKRPN
ncbi:MAG: DNA primase [Syntrophotaleaceae bacterium]